MSGASGVGGFRPDLTTPHVESDPQAHTPAEAGAETGAAGATPTRSAEALLSESGIYRSALMARIADAEGPTPGADALGLSSFTSGSVEVEMPVAGGTHRVDLGTDEKAKLKVEDGTTLTFRAAIEGDGESAPDLTGARFEFSEPVRLKNPGAVIDKFWEEIGDALTDVELTGFTVGEDGKLHLEGEVLFPFGIRKSLSDLVEPDKLPVFDMDLEDVLAGKVIASKPDGGGGGQKVKADRLLTGLGPVIGEGSFDVTLEGEASSIKLGKKGVVIQGNEPGDAKVSISGSADIEGGAFVLDGDARIDTGAASITAELGASARPGAGLRSDITATVDVLDADLVLGNGQRFAIDGNRTAADITAEARIMTGGGSKTIDGSFHVETGGSADAILEEDTLQGAAALDIDVASDGSFRVDGRHVTLDAPTRVTARPTGGDFVMESKDNVVPVSVVGEGSVITGTMDVTVDGRDVRIRDGSADVHLNLDVEQPSLTLLGGQLELDGTSLISGTTKFGYDKQSGFNVSDGKVDLIAGVNEGRLETDGLRVSIGEGSSITAQVSDIALTKDGGLVVGSTKGMYDFRLTGAEVEIGPLEVQLSGSLESHMKGTSELLLWGEGMRPSLQEQGTASVDFLLHARDMDVDAPGGSLALGDGAKVFKGDAKLQISPGRVEILEGEFNAQVDLGGSVYTRSPQAEPAPE
jgi:hypothetical protein